MARGRASSPETVLSVLDTATDSPSLTTIARQTGVPYMTVQNLLAKYEPVAGMLRLFKRDWFVGMWQAVAAGAVTKLHDGVMSDEMKAGDAFNWARTAGIATDKVLLLTGQPTQITAEIHEVRLRLPELVGKLAAVARRLPESTVDTTSKKEQ